MAENNKPPLQLTRATAEDIPEITRLVFKAFPSPVVREVFLGGTEERAERLYGGEMAHNRHDVWIKVVDPATGAIVAATNWRIYPNGAPADYVELPPPGLEGDALARSQAVMDGRNASRKKHMPGPFVHLNACCTDPDFQRRGAGALMMKWGCDLADHLFLPAWVESSVEGALLYRKFGFYDVEKQAVGDGMNMRREPKMTAIDGAVKS